MLSLQFFYLTVRTSSGAVQPVTVSLTGPRGQDGIRQIVLATASDHHEVESEATEISVTIPAALAGQAATEELLQAVEAHNSESDQATFVAMQSVKYIDFLSVMLGESIIMDEFTFRMASK